MKELPQTALQGMRREAAGIAAQGIRRSPEEMFWKGKTTAAAGTAAYRMRTRAAGTHPQETKMMQLPPTGFQGCGPQRQICRE